jgi:GST-like protein
MIDLYTWTTPNGYKIPIMLEEAGIDYTTHMINIGQGEQNEDSFQDKNPNEKIPVIVDRDGPDGEELTLFESGAILWYLGEKSEQFIPDNEREKYHCLQWLFFQNANVGPMMGQLGHFRRAEKQINYALDRYSMETMRLLSVLEESLSESTYLAGEEYSVADISTWTWVRMAESFDISFETYPHVKKWVDKIAERDAVAGGMKVLDDAKENLG